jgi:zinc transporter ZupT
MIQLPVRGAISLICCVVVYSIPAVAHVEQEAAFTGINAKILVLVAASLSASFGFFALLLHRNLNDHFITNIIEELFGPSIVFVGIGIFASSATHQSTATFLSVILGGGITYIIAIQDIEMSYLTLSIVAIAIHRFLEGIALAPAFAESSTIGYSSGVILMSHFVIECIAIGGSDGHNRAQAVISVVSVSIIFVFGVLLGGWVISGSKGEVQSLVASFISGILIVSGAEKILTSNAVLLILNRHTS